MTAWSRLSRLETRTKGSNMCASFSVLNLQALWKLMFRYVHLQPTVILKVLLSNCHKCQDQKVGELFLRGEGSRETLVEPRSDTDVQIVCYTWVQGRSTDGTFQPLVPSKNSLRIT